MFYGRGDIHSGTRSLWRNAASFPVAVANPVTMGDGCTPLVEHQWRGGRAYFKLEWFAPTGGFKDRGASVMISALRQQGVTRLLEDSSGNGGAAIAAYAATGGIKAKILIPAYTQPSKTVQMRAYGAEVELIAGTRQDTVHEAERQAERIFYASRADGRSACKSLSVSAELLHYFAKSDAGTWHNRSLALTNHVRIPSNCHLHHRDPQ